jgi:4-carboxymuconolactone decarboxylase
LYDSTTLTLPAAPATLAPFPPTVQEDAMARVKPIVNRDDVAPEHHALFDELAALRGRISGPSTVVLHSPGLARPWNQISEYLHRDSIVEAPHAELAVCATARERDCGYVWNAHVPLARKAGISAETIAAVAGRRPAAELPEGERAVVLYVQQLLRNNRVDGDVFDRLLSAHSPRWLVELTVWIGRYAALSGILNAFEVTPSSPAETLPPVPRAPRAAAGARAPLPAPRLTPIVGRDQVPEEYRAVFDAVTEGRGGVRGPFPMLLYSPVLCRRHLDVGTHLRFESRLSPAERELAIVATAREKDCPYIWAAHAPAARKAGVGDAVVAVVRDRGDLAAVPPAERDVIDYVRQLLRESAVTQPVFDRLRDAHGVTWLVELTCLVGHYGIVASILNAFELAPRPDAEPL